jgi:hypothetical protein
MDWLLTLLQYTRWTHCAQMIKAAEDAQDWRYVMIDALFDTTLD